VDIIPDNFDLPLDVDITENQAKDFVESIQRALIAQKSSLYLYSWERNAIVISFDDEWNPFLCAVKGYNTKPQRTKIYPIGDVFKMVIHAYQKAGRDQYGGRSFFTSDCVFYVDESNDIFELVRWDWPLGDLVEEISLMI